MTTLETERLLLRPWRAADFEPYAAYYADAVLAKYVGGVSTRDEAWRRLAAVIGHWTLTGFGYWAVEEKESAVFVGCVGLWFSDGWPELELGYWIVPEKHGRGYATEAGVASRDAAWNTVKTNSLVSYIHPDNDPSKRVAERLGASYEQTIQLCSFGDHCVYRYPKPA